jgi:hypothetical protein
MTELPSWSQVLIAAYESGAHSQFIISGNVGDRLLLPLAKGPELGSLQEFLLKVLLPRFEVVFSYDLGNGLRVEQGGEHVAQWPWYKEVGARLPRAPREAIDCLSQYLRYCLNLTRLGQRAPQVACFIRSVDLVAPANSGQESNAIASQLRDWANEGLVPAHRLATFLIAENKNDVHPLIAANPRALALSVPLPSAAEVADALTALRPLHAIALRDFADVSEPAAQLSGATLAAVEALLKKREHAKQPLRRDDLSALKKALVEQDCQGLIEFITATRTLDDYQAQPALKEALRQDLELWRRGDLGALPKGYLLCGPVGTGKTFLVECLAGEAGVPVVKLKNFRDKWVGSTEGNLEKIFRLVHALGRCYVFIDEADQALGKRDGGGSDGGIGGRIYAMMAEEMSSPANRGKIIWILATSRPDLVEVDLKRPGRVDVKIPIFPTTSAREGFDLLRALGKRKELPLAETDFTSLEALIPELLTPGAAEALVVKAYRRHRIASLTPLEALRDSLVGYQHPVPRAILAFQIRIAVDEASDASFVPAAMRAFATPAA